MAKRIEDIENPMIQIGYAQYHTYKEPSTYPSTACDVCDRFEATVQFKQTCLCDSCAAEEGIKVL
jgi:hypothetical protein